MFDRFRHAVLRPTDASFFLNQKRYRAIICCICIGILLATTERTAQAKQMEHNLWIASHLHSAVTSELSSIILMARSGSKDDGTLERIETVARLSLANMHSIIRILSDTGNADTDESHKSPDITAYAQALDHNAQSMGFTGRLSIRLDSFPVSNSQFMLIQLCIKELYANITRHMAKNGGEYSITISGSENSIRITETNPSSGNPNELTSGFGLSLLEHQLEVSGGAIRYGLSGNTWHVEVTIPSGLAH